MALKGICKVTAKGRAYYYAWRGGPRINAEPGTPEFLAEWQRLTAAPPSRHTGTLQAILTAYQRAPDFTELAEETRKGYIRRIAKIEKEFGDMPIKALSDPRVRADFLDWRDRIAETTRREADYCMSVLQAALSWARNRGMIAQNPVDRPGRRYRGSRVDSVWSDDQITEFLRTCPAQLRLPFLLALDTGQREKDVLRLKWSAYDGQTIRLAQSKGGRRVIVPVSARLKAALDATKRTRGATVICTNSRGLPWTLDGFKATWRKHRPDGLTFHDLRGTAVLHLALAGCTEAEIVSVTGHSTKAANEILDRHYLHRDQRLAEVAIAKRESHASGTGHAKPAAKPSARLVPK